MCWRCTEERRGNTYGNRQGACDGCGTIRYRRITFSNKQYTVYTCDVCGYTFQEDKK